MNSSALDGFRRNRTKTSASIIACFALVLGLLFSQSACTTTTKQPDLTSHPELEPRLLTDLEFSDFIASGYSKSRNELLRLMQDRILIGTDDPEAYEFLALDRENKKRVRAETCEQYLKFKGQGAFAYTTADMTTESWFMRASGALKFLGRARASKTTDLPDDLLPRLSVSFMAEEDNGEKGRAESSIRELARTAGVEKLQMQSHRIDFEFQDKSITIEEMARGDWNGDGLEDGLIFVAWHYLEGSGRGYSLAWIPGGQGNFKAYRVEEFKLP